MEWISDEPFSSTYKDLYFSKNQAIEEANFVYIQGNNLPSRWEGLKKNEVFNIVELGFGAGINFLTTLKEWSKNPKSHNWLNYLSIENNPLSLADFQKIHEKYSELELFSNKMMDTFPLNCQGCQRIEFLKERVSLTIYFGEVCQCLQDLEPGIFNLDACYHDGFSPDRNLKMWSSQVFKSLANLSHKGSTYSTFSAAKIIKERLIENDFKIEIIKGFGNKRHMLRAEFKSTLTKRKSDFKKKIAIVGAGIAGCTSAKILSSRGYEVTLFEKNKKIVSGGSGNKALILYPRLSAFDTPYSSFCLHSYLYSIRFYDEIGSPHWNKTGALFLEFSKETKKRFQQLLAARNDSKLFKSVSPEEASSIAGIKLTKGGLFFPEAGWLDPKGACDLMIQNSNIRFIGEEVINIKKTSKFKVISNNHEYDFDQVCLCSSYEHGSLIDLKGISKKRGQVTYLQNNTSVKNLKVPIFAKGYISPAPEELKIIGSTYNDKNIKDITLEENQENLEKLKHITNRKVIIEGAKYGYRATTQDHLPLVGKTKHNIYVNIGHGSRGSSSAPIGAQFVCDLMSGSPPIFGKKISEALDPERFKGKS